MAGRLASLARPESQAGWLFGGRTGAIAMLYALVIIVISYNGAGQSSTSSGVGIDTSLRFPTGPLCEVARRDLNESAWEGLSGARIAMKCVRIAAQRT